MTFCFIYILCTYLLPIIYSIYHLKFHISIGYFSYDGFSSDFNFIIVTAFEIRGASKKSLNQYFCLGVHL